MVSQGAGDAPLTWPNSSLSNSSLEDLDAYGDERFIGQVALLVHGTGHHALAGAASRGADRS